MRKKKPQGTPKTMAGRAFSSNPVNTNLSLTAAHSGQAETQQQKEATANSTSTSGTKVKEQATDQSIQAPNINSDSLDIYRAFSVVQEIMAELKSAAFEEAKFIALATFVSTFMEENRKKSS
jgi:hypothetical protein